jgi:pimeloyl-ACP methyl ester carboxylesterase
MSNIDKKSSDGRHAYAEVRHVFTRRAQRALDQYNTRIKESQEQYVAAVTHCPTTPWELWQAWSRYAVDFAERSVLFWETLRKRGNKFLEHQRAGKPPVLHFEYRMILDARKFQRPVNYALVEIVPPGGVAVDATRRPYIVIDPRAGHGPGIGGFKDDSEIGAALRAGHPVYFVMFFPEPEPKQTLMDVCSAEQEFVRAVRALHPDSPKPVIVGNCQGGWAAMMLAASDPELTGPVVINGAPMSYWGGGLNDEQVNNPMRYLGGLAGGSWPASFLADLGNGIFDGAYLVQNFEALDPANTLWDKYYHLFANIDTEPPRFLDFERWWGGFYLLGREEIDFIVRNLFVGNKLWSGETQALGEKVFDLKEIRSPIILFASLGDNITPPQQAFNWVADIYGSTDEIKARGQTIIGLVHESIGHLGIFVSGKVATKEHAAIVSVMKSIEALPPGLFAMQIKTTKDEKGKETYTVEFVERQLEEVMERINRFGRRDEKPFQAAAAVSEFNQRAYEATAAPWIQGMSNDFTAKMMRLFHPLRMERWLWSDLNPCLAWLHPAAENIAPNRHAMDKEQPPRQVERMFSEVISASLDYYRDMRDATSELAFYLMYGNVFALQAVDRREAPASVKSATPPRLDKEAVLSSMNEGGYPEAVCRARWLLARKGKPLPLAELEVRNELLKDYAKLLPKWTPDQRRKASGRQEIICREQPEMAIETLPLLLSDDADRARFFKLVDMLLADVRLNETITPEQTAMVKRMRRVCNVHAGPVLRRAG